MTTARELVVRLKKTGATNNQIDKAFTKQFGVGIVDISKRGLFDNDMRDIGGILATAATPEGATAQARNISTDNPTLDFKGLTLDPSDPIPAVAEQPTVVNHGTLRATPVSSVGTSPSGILAGGGPRTESTARAIRGDAKIDSSGRAVRSVFDPIGKAVGTLIGAGEVIGESIAVEALPNIEGRLPSAEEQAARRSPIREAAKLEEAEIKSRAARVTNAPGVIMPAANFLMNSVEDSGETISSAALIAAEYVFPQLLDDGDTSVDMGRKLGRELAAGSIGGTIAAGANPTDAMLARPVTTALAAVPVIGGFLRGVAMFKGRRAALSAARRAAVERTVSNAKKSEGAIRSASIPNAIRDYTASHVSTVMDAIEKGFDGFIDKQYLTTAKRIIADGMHQKDPRASALAEEILLDPQRAASEIKLMGEAMAKQRSKGLLDVTTRTDPKVDTVGVTTQLDRDVTANMARKDELLANRGVLVEKLQGVTPESKAIRAEISARNARWDKNKKDLEAMSAAIANKATGEAGPLIAQYNNRRAAALDEYNGVKRLDREARELEVANRPPSGAERSGIFAEIDSIDAKVAELDKTNTTLNKQSDQFTEGVTPEPVNKDVPEDGVKPVDVYRWITIEARDGTKKRILIKVGDKVPNRGEPTVSSTPSLSSGVDVTPPLREQASFITIDNLGVSVDRTMANTPVEVRATGKFGDTINSMRQRLVDMGIADITKIDNEVLDVLNEHRSALLKDQRVRKAATALLAKIIKAEIKGPLSDTPVNLARAVLDKVDPNKQTVLYVGNEVIPLRSLLRAPGEASKADIRVNLVRDIFDRAANVASKDSAAKQLLGEATRNSNSIPEGSSIFVSGYETASSILDNVIDGGMYPQALLPNTDIHTTAAAIRLNNRERLSYGLPALSERAASRLASRIEKFEKLDPAVGLGDLWVDPAMKSTVEWHVKSRDSLTNDPTIQKAIAGIKANYTARSASSILNNTMSNTLMQVLRRGIDPITYFKSVYESQKMWSEYQGGKPSPMLEAISSTGLFDANALDADIGVVRNGGIVTDIGSRIPGSKLLEKMFELGDTLAKLEEATTQYRAWESRLDDLGKGNFMEMPMTPRKTARVTRTGSNTFNVDIYAGNKKLRSVGEVTAGSKKMNRIIGKASAKPGLDLMFAYDDTSLGAKVMRTMPVAGIGSTYFTWAIKSLDIPMVKRGLVSMVVEDPFSFRTNDPTLIKKQLKAGIELSARRALIVGVSMSAINSSDNSKLQEALKWSTSDDKIALVRVLGDQQNAEIIDLSSVNFASQTQLLFRLGALFLSKLGTPGVTKLYESEFVPDEVRNDPNYKSPELTPKRKKELYQLKSLLIKEQSGQLATAKDVLSLIGLAGGPVADAWMKIIDAEEAGRAMDIPEMYKVFAPMLFGTTTYRVTDVAMGAAAEATDGAVPFSASTRGKSVKEEERNSEKFFRWMLRRLLGKGTQVKDLNRRSDPTVPYSFYNKARKTLRKSMHVGRDKKLGSALLEKAARSGNIALKQHAEKLIDRAEIRGAIIDEEIYAAYDRYVKLAEKVGAKGFPKMLSNINSTVVK